MSKGSIIDYRVRITPSRSLIDFIQNLENVQSMPENILNIYLKNAKGGKNINNIEFEEVVKEKFTDRQIEILKSINTEQSDDEKSSGVDNFDSVEDEHNIRNEKNSTKQMRKAVKIPANKHKLLLELTDLRWLDKLLSEKRKAGECNTYLHELLEKCDLILPKNEIIPRNPELEARCRKLREEQDAREYRNMTKNVDSIRKYQPEDTIGYQLRSMNRQLIAVLQFIFSVVAGFAFGFIGVELIIGNMDFGFRLLLGIMCALTIALAEIYFLAKKLNEFDEIEDDPNQLKTKKPHLD